MRLEAATADGARELLQQETLREERLETLERKLKIAVRKKKHEKVEKIRKKIAALRDPVRGEHGDGADGDGDGISDLDSDASDWCDGGHFY
jgi:glutamate synthase domain-containing protein 1